MLEMSVVFGCVLVVFGCVSMCCVVFVVLLVASVLASMLLCGGHGSEEKNDICNYRKISRERVVPSRFYIHSKIVKKTH